MLLKQVRWMHWMHRIPRHHLAQVGARSRTCPTAPSTTNTGVVRHWTATLVNAFVGLTYGTAQCQVPEGGCGHPAACLGSHCVAGLVGTYQHTRVHKQQLFTPDVADGLATVRPTDSPHPIHALRRQVVRGRALMSAAESAESGRSEVGPPLLPPPDIFPPGSLLVNVNNRLVPENTPLNEGDLVILARDKLKI